MSLEYREYYGFTGPMNLSKLPSNIESLFRESYDLPGDFKFDDIEGKIGKTDWENQVPACLHDFIPELKQEIWTTEMINTGIHVARENINSVTPPHYPHAGKMIQDAINKIPPLDKHSKILIAGSVSPWIESVCLVNQFTDITTSDYGVRNVDDSRIKFVHAHDIDNMKFDLIITFSSIEHDGLGRYGDPINPYGPFNAVNEFYEKLNDNGYLLCGMPVFPEDKKLHSSQIQGHWHVIFSRKSVEKLFRKFKMIDVINQPDGWGSLWQHQPIYILQKQ